MKKIFFLLLLFSSILANAQYTYQIVARNLTAADNTTSANIIGSGAAFHNLTWNVSGTVSTCSVRVDGSTDGVTWGTGDIIGATTCTSNGTIISSSTIKNYVRINLVTITGAGATFTANLSGYITQPSGGGTLTSLTCGTGITCSPGSPITNTGSISASGSGGALVQLETHAASSSATLDFTTCISGSTYHTFAFELRNIVPATNSVGMQMRFSTNGGSTYDSAANYSWVRWGFNSGGNGVGSSLADNQFQLSNIFTSNTASKGGVSGTIKLSDPLSGTHDTIYVGLSEYVDTAPSVTAFQLGGEYLSSTAVNAIRFLFSSGNIASGTITCYGITP